MFVPASQTEPVVFIYERALVYIVLDIRDMIAEHDCMAKICLPIMPEQLRIPDDSKFSSGGLEVPKRSRFILSFLCFCFFFVYRQQCDFKLQEWSMFSLSRLSSPSDKTQELALCSHSWFCSWPWLPSSTASCKIRSSTCPSGITWQQVLRADIRAPLLLLSLALSLDFLFPASAFIDLLLDCAIKSWLDHTFLFSTKCCFNQRESRYQELQWFSKCE